MLRSAILIATLAPLGVPALAIGATASVSTETQYRTPNKGAPQPYEVSRYSYLAGPGERNQPVLTFADSGRALTIKDDGALIAPGNGCAAIGPSEVRCAAPAGAEVPGLGIATLAVALGDGDDILNAIADVERSVAVDAGPGADQVVVREGEAKGGDGDDVLQSSGTSAALNGGAGSDVLQGGQGDESLTGGLGRDRINGGPGRDTVVFTEETQSVTVDLARPGPAGTAAEPDDVRNVESVSGGQGDDVLRGSEGRNGISGGPGRDLIEAGGGSDSLDGGPGADHVRGGEGNDDLIEDFVASGAADRLQGDAGRDRIYSPSSGATLLGGPGRDLLQFPSGAVRVDGGADDDELEASDLTGRQAASAVRNRPGSGCEPSRQRTDSPGLRVDDAGGWRRCPGLDSRPRPPARR